MLLRFAISALLFVLVPLALQAAAPAPTAAELERSFSATVQPFLQSYCIKCHSGDKPKGDLDLAAFASVTKVTDDLSRWSTVQEKLTAKEMPPPKAKDQPSAEARQQMIDWIAAVRASESIKHAGDPGPVLPRRLSNAELNYSIRDLTGVDLRPAREFPVDPANPAGFDNSGESLAMSPELMTKYLQAARDVADHIVFKPQGLAFASYPMLVETDRDKYCVQQIIDFYHRQDTDFADYFQAAWRFKHRAALSHSDANLTEIAGASKVSAKYLAKVWSLLEDDPEEIGPTAKLQRMWKKLPAPAENQPNLARSGCEQMRDFIVELRKKLEPRFSAPAAKGIGATSQPLLMWKNRQYASHRMTFDRDVLQVAGETKLAKDDAPAKDQVAADENADEMPSARDVRKPRGPDADLAVPAGERKRYEAAFAQFCAVFPDAFYISERGRNYLDKSKDKGRLLSAGFHNLMGYFRDDTPLYELILDEGGQKELDELWQELDFVASANIRTYVQFYLNESGEGKSVNAGATSGTAEEGKAITSEARLHRVRDNYLARARGSSDVAIQAIIDHFESVNAGIRSVEKARLEAEPRHLNALVDFATRAYRRPLTQTEKDDLLAYYRQLRSKDNLDHEAAMRDCVVSVLMSPDFCYRIDLVDDSEAIHPLSDYAVASRLSYFLWSSLPDAELLAEAEAGHLREPAVLAAQARRMLMDERVRAMALEFGGNWLGFRRFEELNTVDRDRFNCFTNELRKAMFEEPVRFMLDVFQTNRSILDFMYADDTFVNPVLAGHYGMPPLGVALDEWTHITDANRFGRGGILPMAAFLTKNAPGLRTSPVKRGYWVVKNVLGERIPPPPAAVPELPRDEAKLDLTLREMLARHREDQSCAACHARFDSLGLVFESYGPVGEQRERDLAGRPIDARATFPDGSEGNGLAGLKQYLKDKRQNDFVDNLCRKLLAYALGRSLISSDDALVADMQIKLASDDYRFANLVESIITSPQFLNKRGRTAPAEK